MSLPIEVLVVINVDIVVFVILVVVVSGFALSIGLDS